MTSSVTQLLDRAQARWAALGTAAPDLAPAITLQRALVNRTIDTVDRLRRLDRPVLNLEPGLAATKLRASTPVLRGEVLELPVDLLGPLVFQACDETRLRTICCPALFESVCSERGSTINVM